MAWLNARPEKAESDKSKAPAPSRREQLEAVGTYHPPMPPCDAHYLVDHLFEIGPTAPAGAGEGAISHVDLAAWMGNTGICLNAWEARTLRRLSMDYLGESHKATKRGHPAPWQAEGLVVDQLVNDIDMKNALRGLAKL